MRHLISMLLQNEPGALARVAGLFASRGYNIESLTAAATPDGTMSRLTLLVFGDAAAVEQIVKQSAKLIDVIDVVDLSGGEVEDFVDALHRLGDKVDHAHGHACEGRGRRALPQK